VHFNQDTVRDIWLFMAAPGEIRIGCAGWRIPQQHAASFPSAASHLARYAQRFTAVEINSSFYHPHRSGTYARWASSVPEGFAFAVKAPKVITHECRLEAATSALSAFKAQIAALDDKLGPLLFQLPPSFPFAPCIVGSFFENLRKEFAHSIVCEPRHESWFTDGADRLLADLRIGRVAADPPTTPRAAEPGGWNGLVYYRLHGAPHVYYSAYSPNELAALARRLLNSLHDLHACWCIFDNTAVGAATVNALALQERLADERSVFG
jgi:uncharacterized protein YecE (DUF72 family)